MTLGELFIMKQSISIYKNIQARGRELLEEQQLPSGRKDQKVDRG